MKCQGDPACPFPPDAVTGRCGQHEVERTLPVTLHEMSGERVRTLEREGDLWRGFSHPVVATRYEKRGRPKMTEEEKRKKYGNTYCKAKLENGVTCNQPIPMNERVCAACRERLLPTK